MHIVPELSKEEEQFVALISSIIISSAKTKAQSHEQNSHSLPENKHRQAEPLQHQGAGYAHLRVVPAQ
ncbi:hypothetical protein [Parasediminibacterium paludis]|uniref:hypothetical protein n=1 Tax=Parasediminibacterium paludis TaxID=908966 RepID=UPI003672BA69